MGYLLSICVHTKRASFGTIFTVLWRPYFKDLWEISEYRQLTFCCFCNRLSRQFEKFWYLSSLNHFDLKVTAARPIKSLLGKAEGISVPEKKNIVWICGMSKASPNAFPVGIILSASKFCFHQSWIGYIEFNSWLPLPAGAVFLAEVYEADKPDRADPWRLLCLWGFNMEE